MTTETFLVEIGTEELPPKSLRYLAQSFANQFVFELNDSFLSHGDLKWFATPRRLALQVKNLSAMQTDRIIEKRGPAIRKSYDSLGKATKSAESWAYKCGIRLDQATRLKTEKGEWLLYRKQIKGQSAKSLLPHLVKTALSKLPIQKLMRWGDKSTKFIRPVHTVTLLLGNKIIPCTLFGIDSDRIIRGHRFMGEETISLDHSEQYPQILLKRALVIANYEIRKAKIKSQIEKIAKNIDCIADIDEELLEEVTALVEWPVVLIARFEKKFLEVPEEALVSTMKTDQKYFPVYDKDGKLSSKFIFVANIDSKDPQQVIAGNEKVIRTRLADAEFFFNTDRKNPLVNYLPLLKNVLFQKQLGTLRDKTDRISMLSGWIAKQIGGDITHAIRAGLLSKCDLMTNMVCAFTEIQGSIGMHYARYDGEDEQVALALHEQYLPRFSGDLLPSKPVSCALAIADKIDTLVGIFGIGQIPKGDKDPFALRRAALGILRIITFNKLPLDLKKLSKEAIGLYGRKLINKNVSEEVLKFFLGRLRAWYQEEGYSVDSIQSVLACHPTKPADFDARIKAVTHFRILHEAEALIAANKRVSNILAKSTDILTDNVDFSLFTDTAELKLATALISLNEQLDPLFSNGSYKEALKKLSKLREIIDFFFDNVMVKVQDNKIRINRLTLLNKIRVLFLKVADISLLK